MGVTYYLDAPYDGTLYGNPTCAYFQAASNNTAYSSLYQIDPLYLFLYSLLRSELFECEDLFYGNTSEEAACFA